MDVPTIGSKYRLSSLAQGLSAKTIRHTLASVGYFTDFLGGIDNVREITGDDLRRFIVALQQKKRRAARPDIKAGGKVSPTSINTYVRATKSF